MRQAKRTPRPWFVNSVREIIGPTAVLIGSREFGTGSTLITKPDEVNGCSSVIARLIAAAPDLLDALKRIIVNSRDADGGDHCHSNCMYCQGHAAIAKATGEST